MELTFFWMLVAYFMGSLSSAVLISKLMNFPDPREHGSKNPGATNVLRLAGKQAALYVLVGDVLKGVLPVALSVLTQAPGWGQSLVGLAAFLGHVYPVFFQFKGGKGVATALGAFLVFSPVLTATLALIWGSTLWVTRYVSLASILTAVCALFLGFWLASENIIGVLLIALGIILRHFSNILRLIEGEEPKLGEHFPSADELLSAEDALEKDETASNGS